MGLLFGVCVEKDLANEAADVVERIMMVINVSQSCIEK